MGAIAGISCHHANRGDLAGELAVAFADFSTAPCTWTSSEKSPVSTCLASLDTAVPYYDQASGLAIVAVARLDDRSTLQQALGTHGHDASTQSDARLILSAFEKWGDRSPEHLLGDFAFAIWDNSKRVLFCARDHIGAQPFYYSAVANRFLFASDLAMVAALPGVAQHLHEPYVAAHLLDPHFEHAELTFLSAIRKLPPGCSLTVCGERVDLRRYWSPVDSQDIRLASDAEYADAFLHLYESSVHDRLRCDSSPGVHLTGGLDSSSIAVIAARQLRQRSGTLSAFSWSPPQTCENVDGDERELIRAVSAQEEVDVCYQTLTADDLIAVLRRDVAREPTVDTLVHERIVQRQALARGVHTLLSGWGGDEFIAFNGRGYEASLLVTGKWSTLYQHCQLRSPRPWRRLLRTAVLPLLPVGCQRLVRARERQRRGASIEDYLRRDVVSDLKRAARELTPEPPRQVGVRRTQLQLLEFGHLTRRIESWASAGIRHNLDYCYPLLDKRVIEFALGLPPEQFVRGPTTRYLMRNAVARLLPAKIGQNRSKADPARMKMLERATSETYAKVGEQLSAGESSPSRSQYIDVARLTERLNSKRPMSIDESCVVWHALQFLNF